MGNNRLDVKMYSPQTLNKFVLEEVRAPKGLEFFLVRPSVSVCPEKIVVVGGKIHHRFGPFLELLHNVNSPS